MDKQPGNMYWLQNNNNDPQMRQVPSGRPNEQRTPQNRPSVGAMEEASLICGC